MNLQSGIDQDWTADDRRSRPRRWVWALVAAAVLLLAVAVGAAIGMLTGPDTTPGVADQQSPTITPEPTATDPSPEASVGPTPTEEVPTATPSSTPTPEAALADGWTLAATFGGGGESVTTVTEVVAVEDRFVAIGHHWPRVSDDLEREVRAWTSVDGGRSWTEHAVDLGTDDVEVGGLAALPDDRLLAVGVVGLAAHRSENEPLSTGAWVSDDGITWEAFAAPFAGVALPELVVRGVDVAAGAAGLVVSTGGTLWHSTDGGTWESVHELPAGMATHGLDAGLEGFVVEAQSTDGESQFVLASADGRQWHRRDQTIDQVTSIGGDWLGAAFTQDPPTISILASANGLDWSEALDVNDLTAESGPKAGQGMESGITEVVLASDGEFAVLTLGFNHCCVTRAAGVEVHASADGADWEQLELRPDAHVSAVASTDRVRVLAGYVDRAAEAAFWVSAR